MSVFNEQGFEKKLLALKDSQESISTLSDWCLQNKQHHKKIVTIWLSVLKKVRVENRLTLFYLANDVVQYSKRKNYDFVESWGTALQKATTMVRHDKVMDRIMRIFKIWSDRSVYSEEFLMDLRGLLTAKKATPATPKQSEQQNSSATSSTTTGEFVPSNLFARMGKCKELEDDTDLKLKKVNECTIINLNDLDAFRTMLKDRKHADGVAGDLDEAIVHVEKYKKALEVEISERKTVIELLQQATKFYETEKSDAKVVFNAYRNFGSRVKSLKRKLDDITPTLASPVPSPDVNAPSPSPDSDIDLPNDEDLSGIVECLEGTAETDSEDDLMSIISYHSSDEENPKYSYNELLEMSECMRRRKLPLPDTSHSDSDLTELDDSFEDVEDFHHQCFQNSRFGPLRAPIKPPNPSGNSSLFGKPHSATCNSNTNTFKAPEPRRGSRPFSNDDGSSIKENCSLNNNLPNAEGNDIAVKVENCNPISTLQDNIKTDTGCNPGTNGFLDLLPSDEDLTGLLECLEDDILDSSAKRSS